MEDSEGPKTLDMNVIFEKERNFGPDLFRDVRKKLRKWHTDAVIALSEKPSVELLADLKDSLAENQVTESGALYRRVEKIAFQKFPEDYEKGTKKLQRFARNYATAGVALVESMIITSSELPHMSHESEVFGRFLAVNTALRLFMPYKTAGGVPLRDIAVDTAKDVVRDVRAAMILRKRRDDIKSFLTSEGILESGRYD
jgi:hypothetical protein